MEATVWRSVVLRDDSSTNGRMTMRRFQNVLLAGAASLLTVATAQAADLPVKVKPIQYVKVCSLYGAGSLLHSRQRHLPQGRRLSSRRS